MSVLIKGINKPKDCGYCQFCIEEDVMFETEFRCSITGIYMDEDHCFPDICPIVTLPEHHGRLIDADVVTNKYGKWYTEEGLEEGFIGTIKDIINLVPTVIKAE